MIIETETFWTLLRDKAHWEFEIFVSLVVDVVFVGLIWQRVKKHWNHHLARDKKEGL